MYYPSVQIKTSKGTLSFEKIIDELRIDKDYRKLFYKKEDYALFRSYLWVIFLNLTARCESTLKYYKKRFPTLEEIYYRVCQDIVFLPKKQYLKISRNPLNFISKNQNYILQEIQKRPEPYYTDINPGS